MTRLSTGKMFPPKWSIWCFLLILPTSNCVLKLSGYEDHEVICSKGLSSCTMEDVMPFPVGQNHAVDVQKLMPHFKLCCEDGHSCKLCLVVDTEISIATEVLEDKVSSGLEEDDSEETSNPKASVTVCYKTAHGMPACKKVEFTVNHAALTHTNLVEISMVITALVGVSFSSKVTVYSLDPPRSIQQVDAPSLNEVCSQEMPDRVDECDVPKLEIRKINQESKSLELQFAGRNKSRSMCVQYEQNGRCQRWSSMNIPLYLVTTCMCLQTWESDKVGQTSRRSQYCPFINKTENSEDFFQRNIWDNVSMSVGQGQMNNKHTMLLWNLSAPCRLKGEVWPCHRENSCREMKGFRQQLANGTWTQHSNGRWEIIGVFEDINLEFSPCVMVKIKGIESELGPVCFRNTDRWRWSLLVVGVMLLVCVTVLIFHPLHSFVKKWVWSWHHGKFVEIGGKRHVVLLSPPDMDEGVSESVCQLGSLLSARGFSVCVDQWSRKEQCSRGPLPWLHSQLLELKKNTGGRVVLILTRRALDIAEEWTRRQKEVIRIKAEDNMGPPQTASPYTDVFMAALCLVQADKQLGRAGERFLLVKFDSRLCSEKRLLPEPFQGVPMFQLPSQTDTLCSELTVERTGGRTWARWTWRWRTKTDKKSLETEPLKHQKLPC